MSIFKKLFKKNKIIVKIAEDGKCLRFCKEKDKIYGFYIRYNTTKDAAKKLETFLNH